MVAKNKGSKVTGSTTNQGGSPKDKSKKKAKPVASKTASKKEAEIRVNERKWTKTLMDAGWTAFPSIILEKQHTLGLNSVDINILLYLSTFWWEAGNKPHPSKKKIATALGRTPRTIQRRIASMESMGYLRREYRKGDTDANTSNKYHFDGLIEKVKPFALEKNQMKKEKEDADARRLARKQPRKKSK